MTLPSQQAGSTLIEALVALVLLTVVLLAGLSLLSQEPRADRRLRAHQEAVRAAEAALEELRGSDSPLAPGSRPVAVGSGGEGAAEELAVRLRVVPAGLAGLYEASATVVWKVSGQRHLETVRTLLWSP